MTGITEKLLEDEVSGHLVAQGGYLVCKIGTSPEKQADFDARLAKFGADSKAAKAAVKDLDSLKSTWGPLLKDNCGGCHEKYRVKKS